MCYWKAHDLWTRGGLGSNQWPHHVIWSTSACIWSVMYLVLASYFCATPSMLSWSPPVPVWPIVLSFIQFQKPPMTLIRRRWMDVGRNLSSEKKCKVLNKAKSNKMKIREKKSLFSPYSIIQWSNFIFFLLSLHYCYIWVFPKMLYV